MKNTETEFIKLTPKYLFDKGIRYYNEFLDMKPKNDNAIIESQQVYANAMLYLQGAMFLGSSDASNFLIKINNESEINNQSLSSER